MWFLNAYFDSDDFENPVKQFIDSRRYFPVQFHTKHGADVYITRTYASLDDSIVPFMSSKNMSFYSVNNINYFTADPNRFGYSLTQINIRIDYEFDLYERSVYTIMDLLSDIGGIQNSLLIIGLLIVGLANEKLFFASLIREIY